MNALSTTLTAAATLAAGALAPAAAAPSSVLIHDATVHTASTAGVLEHTDVLIVDGKIV
jgi:hypothetical protein